MNIWQMKDEARDSLTEHSFSSALFLFICLLITTVPGLLVDVILSGGIESWVNETHSPPLVYVIQFLLYLAFTPLQITIYWYFLKLIRDQDVKMALIFTGYRRARTAIKLIWTNVLMILFVFLWSLLFVIPGIICSLAYSQIYFILHDHPEYSAMQTIKESGRLMKGNKWRFFVLQLSFIGWWLLTILPVCLGIVIGGILSFAFFPGLIGNVLFLCGAIGSIWLFLWVLSYYNATLASFYEQLPANRQSGNE